MVFAEQDSESLASTRPEAKKAAALLERKRLRDCWVLDNGTKLETTLAAAKKYTHTAALILCYDCRIKQEVMNYNVYVYG